jgi:predicted metal-dependent peptidase
MRDGDTYVASAGDFSLRATYGKEFHTRTQPVHVMLVVDASGSMSGAPIEAVMQAMGNIQTWLAHPKDSMSMWTFNDKVLHKMKPTCVKLVDVQRLRKDVVQHVQVRFHI